MGAGHGHEVLVDSNVARHLERRPQPSETRPVTRRESPLHSQPAIHRSFLSVFASERRISSTRMGDSSRFRRRGKIRYNEDVRAEVGLLE